MVGPRLSVLAACFTCLLWASGLGQEVPQDTPVPCDDKGIDTAVDAALLKLNEMLKSGNIYALYQIHEVKKVGCIILFGPFNHLFKLHVHTITHSVITN